MTKTTTITLALLAVSSAACTQPVAETGDATAASQSAALETEDYDVDGDAGGQTDLWWTDAGLCYLTAISGDMSASGSPGDDFRVAGSHVQLTATGGQWHVIAYPGTRATARCTPWTDFKGAGSLHLVSTPAGWDNAGRASYWTSLWDDTALCFLGGYGGDTQASSWAEATQYGTSAWAFGFQMSGGHDFFGSAMCVRTGRTDKWLTTGEGFAHPGLFGGRSTFAWYPGMPDVYLMKQETGVCMLNGIGGQFRGWGESIAIVKEDGWYKLRGAAMQPGVHASALCVPFQQSAPTYAMSPGPVHRVSL